MIKRKKITVIMILIFVLTIMTIGIIANADIVKNSQSALFDAEITFYILTGEGCACKPIEGLLISAFGGAGNDSGVTDIDGKCILNLEINSEYEVFIEKEDYQEINFEFNILDDQTFTFHLFEKEESSESRNLFNFQLIKHFFMKLHN